MPQPEVFEVDAERPEDLERVVDAMVELTAAQQGWITLQPGIHPDDAPRPQSIIGKVFTAHGPPVPVCTWVAPQPKQKPPHPEIGVLHGRGPKAEQRLAGLGQVVPDHWVVLADHSKRGLVVAIHPEADPHDVLAWLLAAGTALTMIPVTGKWRIEVHRS